jgi:hypothetical protein
LVIGVSLELGCWNLVLPFVIRHSDFVINQRMLVFGAFDFPSAQPVAP